MKYVSKLRKFETIYSGKGAGRRIKLSLEVKNISVGCKMEKLMGIMHLTII